MGKMFGGRDFNVRRRRIRRSGKSARVILGWAKVALLKENL